MGLKIVKGVLHNFLGAYTSRNSDYNGYWLMGMIVRDLQDLKIDLLLLNESSAFDSPVAFAVDLAGGKFREQLRKAGLNSSRVREAQLSITRLPDLQNGWINDRQCVGNAFRFAAKVVTDRGREYERDTVILVCPHDPEVELRSTRA